MRRWGAFVLILALPGVGSSGSAATQLERVSVSTDGRGANDSSFTSQITSDGTKVVFLSFADNLVRGGEGQGYLRDRSRSTTRVVTLSSAEKPANMGANYVRISPNGRFVAFCTESTNIVRPDEWGAETPLPQESRYMDVFVRDLRQGVTRRASSNRRGGMANGYSCFPEVSNDGDVVFYSIATNLVRDDTNKESDIFLYDWRRDHVRRVSVSASGKQSNGSNTYAGISADGSVIAFMSSSGNLTPGDEPTGPDLLLRFGSGRLLEVPWPSDIGNAGSCAFKAGDVHLSRDGRYLLLSCWHRSQGPDGFDSRAEHLYRYDHRSGGFERLTPISIHEDSGAGVDRYDMSQDGRFVSWCTGNIYEADDQNVFPDVFVKDIERDRMARIVNDPDEGAGTECGSELSDGAGEVIFDARYGYAPDDDNEATDVYLAPDPLSD